MAMKTKSFPALSTMKVTQLLRAPKTTHAAFGRISNSYKAKNLHFQRVLKLRLSRKCLKESLRKNEKTDPINFMRLKESYE